VDEICKFKDAFQSNAALWIFERLNLLGCTAATHSDLCVPMQLGKLIKVRGSNARELKVSNCRVNGAKWGKGHSLA
jgi:hypothetical protein